jgi:hypothetical protein
MTREAEDVVEEIGFDGRVELELEDVVEIEIEGLIVPCVLAAVLEHDDTVYAVLQPQEGDDPDLLLARFDEAAIGLSRFSPEDDPEVVRRVFTLLLTILPVQDVDGVDAGTDEA